MALLFGKAVTNCFLGLIIQAIKILGLKFLKVLWDGVYKQEEAQVGLVRLLILWNPDPPSLCRPPVGVTVSLPYRLQKALLPFSTAGSFANCWREAQGCSFTGLTTISRQRTFEV